MRTYKEEILSAMANDHPDAESGDAQTPIGHFALVEIYENVWDRAECQLDPMEEALGIPNLSNEDIDPGWYLVRLDDHGFLSITLMGSEAEARAEFERLDGEYAAWCETLPKMEDPHF